MRTSNPEDILTDEKAEDALRTLEKVVQNKANENQDAKTKAVSRFREVVTDTQIALDVVFSAGTLATQTGVARPDSAQYASNLQDGKYQVVLKEAKVWLKSTAKKIGDLDPDSSDFLEHWLGKDAYPFQMAIDLLKQMKNTMKRSYALAKTQLANPKRLGARPRKPGYQSNAYPTVPTTLEEAVTPTPGGADKWMQENKYAPKKTYEEERKARPSA